MGAFCEGFRVLVVEAGACARSSPAGPRMTGGIRGRIWARVVVVGVSTLGGLGVRLLVCASR